MAAISRLQLQLLHFTPSLKSPSIFSRFPHFSRSSPRKFFPPRLLCSVSDSTPQNSSSEAGSSSSIVGDLLDYLNESWTQFHATAEAKRQLVAAGFHLLDEDEEWDLKPGGCYFFTRNMSCLVAFSIGEKYVPGNGFHVIAAHTDSPCLKLKPKSSSNKCNCLMVNVQTYGGGLWHTWFDRDLSVAGRVIVRGSDGSYLHKLVKVRRPLLRIPTLAIHLDRRHYFVACRLLIIKSVIESLTLSYWPMHGTVNQDGFKPNLETQLIPLLATKTEDNSVELKDKSNDSFLKDSIHPLLKQVISEELCCAADDIVSFELNVCDTQPSCLGGGNEEFIFSGRLDNLASSYCALRALIDSCESTSDLKSEQAVRMVALFDNEEVGSGSIQGAGAPTMFQAMRRIASGLAQGYVGEGAFERAFRQSFLVSADMAHGVHPNFTDKHEEHHRPEMQKGIVIKHNANQRYATSGVTAFFLEKLAEFITYQRRYPYSGLWNPSTLNA
ncbi:hypothetical protein Csa_018224 [Cucumis sativus]|nr:hypothetical protein Csa_018224 [Cucumis sativus]